VSPLWPDEIHALLTPTTLTMSRVRPWFRPTTVAEETLPITEQMLEGTPPWTGPLRALDHVLGTDPWTRGNLVVVLSNHFVRYRVIPWQYELRDERELIAYARQIVRHAFGRSADDWAVTVSIDRVGDPVVASAIDAALFEELKHCAARQHRRLISVRPLLMEAFNLARAWLTGACYWLAVVEEKLICAALVGRGRWVVVRTVRVHTDWPSELVALLEREQLLVKEAESAQTVLLHVVDGSYRELPASQWTVQPLRAAHAQRMVTSESSCAR